MYSYSYKAFLYTTWPKIKKFTTIAIKKPLLSITLGLGSLYSLKVLGSTFFSIKESRIEQELVSKVFAEGGFENESLNAFKDVLSKVSYEVGHTISNITYNFTKGLLKRYETLLTDIAPYIDKYLTGLKKDK